MLAFGKISLWLLAMAAFAVAEDFYELLGVGKQATDREIRKAFKQLAIKMHPDKNQDDPQAHDKFIKINRAYEVLKDDELRKKYDMHGEDGLKEDQQRGSQYRSWNFYKEEFGIYDDDPEVITLNKADFVQSVESSGDVWFINFYSPHCSHCHHLAPTWREVARELEGVIRIGAVNCEDDWMLCREQGIGGYPTLMMFPTRERYDGIKTTAALIEHAMKKVTSKVVKITKKNLEDLRGSSQPVLLAVCGDGGDCLEKNSRTKLAAMLDELVSVMSLNCHSDVSLCHKLKVEYGTMFYPSGDSLVNGRPPVLSLTSLDAKEITLAVLDQLPEVVQLTDAQIQEVFISLREGREQQPWLLHFVDSGTKDLELRKLPALLKGQIKVGRVDCRDLPARCREVFISKFPSFALFKSGGGHEFHHGRMVAHDIAAFAKDVSQNQVVTLGPADFPDRVITPLQPWFIDFFAPWCPPCMNLLPEFRKASKVRNDIKFGTVDCTIHTSLCQSYNIHSYPTTILYNQTVPHPFHGQHASWALVEFIEDTLNPVVISLNTDSHRQLVENKAYNDMWLVDYYAPWCGHCQQMAPEWRKLAKMLKDTPNVRVASVDCVANGDLCGRVGIRGYPAVRLYPPQSSSSKFYMYNAWQRDAMSFHAWAYEFMPSVAVDIAGTEFEEVVIRSHDPWIIDFFTPWCGHCKTFAPSFELVAQTMQGQVKAGKVNCEQFKEQCRNFGVRAYPTIRYYRDGIKTLQTFEEISSQFPNDIINLLKSKISQKKINSGKPAGTKKEEL